MGPHTYQTKKSLNINWIHQHWYRHLTLKYILGTDTEILQVGSPDNDIEISHWKLHQKLTLNYSRLDPLAGKQKKGDKKTFYCKICLIELNSLDTMTSHVKVTHHPPQPIKIATKGEALVCWFTFPSPQQTIYKQYLHAAADGVKSLQVPYMRPCV